MESLAARCADGTPPGLNSHAGVFVSNRGGYQSFPDTLRQGGPGCSVLLAIMSAAMDVLRSMSCATFDAADPCGCDGDEPPWASQPWRPGGLYSVDAWANVNRSGHYNVLHQHGAEQWSAVYFVCEGLKNVRDEDCSGRLVFRGGPAKMRRGGGAVEWSSHTFLAVPPVPGMLWLFPGKIPHAVMPAPPVFHESESNTMREASSAPCPRISVAANFWEAKPPAPRPVTS
eukprot:438205-Prymnesium_polylepis.1